MRLSECDWCGVHCVNKITKLAQSPIGELAVYVGETVCWVESVKSIHSLLILIFTICMHTFIRLNVFIIVNEIISMNVTLSTSRLIVHQYEESTIRTNVFLQLVKNNVFSLAHSNYKKIEPISHFSLFEKFLWIFISSQIVCTFVNKYTPRFSKKFVSNRIWSDSSRWKKNVQFYSLSFSLSPLIQFNFSHQKHP